MLPKTVDRSTGTAAQNRERSPPYAPHNCRSDTAQQYAKMTSWAQVSKCWKVDNGDDFDAKALELYFPAAKDHEGAEARKAIWKSMDNNNNKYVSLAEYDGWFNQSGSRRPVVWRCLHAIDATRLQERRRWVVSFSISGRSHGLARRTPPCAACWWLTAAS